MACLGPVSFRELRRSLSASLGSSSRGLCLHFKVVLIFLVVLVPFPVHHFSLFTGSRITLPLHVSRFTLMQHHTQNPQHRPHSNRRQLRKIKPVNIAALKKNRRRNMHEDADDKCHQLPAVGCQRRMSAQ